jgi:hypothetical protein
MGLIDRFTRDDVSAKVWWPFTLVLLVLVLLTFAGQQRSEADVRSAARAWFADDIVPTLQNSLAEGDVQAPLDAPAADVVRAALADTGGHQALRAVRLWAEDGLLLFSSGVDDAIGSREALNDAQIVVALTDPSRDVTVTSTRTHTGLETSPLYQGYRALPTTPATVAEMEMDETTLLAATRATWQGYRITGLAALALVLALALLSMREPVAPIGAGVPFFATSLPRGHVLIDADDEARLRQAGAWAKSRVASTEGRVSGLEAQNRALQAELQQALSSLARRTPARAMPAPVPAVERAAPPIRAAVPEPGPSKEPLLDLVVLPDSEPAVPVAAAPPEAEATAEDPDPHDVLARLVGPVGGEGDPTVDPSDVRARLARTAALKKPGSRERREERERQKRPPEA